MKRLSAPILSILLTGCVTSNNLGNNLGNDLGKDPVSASPKAVKRVLSPQSAVTVKAVDAFTHVCLRTAPSFSGAVEAAKLYGIDIDGSGLSDLGLGNMGMSDDRKLGVQIKEGNECAVTTPSQTEQDITASFFQKVSEFTKKEVRATNPTLIELSGVKLIVGHDRRGGEAYVISAKK